MALIRGIFELDLPKNAAILPQDRRKIINTIPQNIPSNIHIIKEYIEMLDGTLLYSKCYIPNKLDISKQNIFILYVPGYKGRIDGYETGFFSNLSSKYNYIIFTYDHYSHGKSDGKWLLFKNKYQFFNHALYILEYAKNKYYNYLYNKYDNKLKAFKYILMGHSMVCRYINLFL